MKQDNYYKPLSDKAFADIKVSAIAIWNTYDNKYGYVTEEINKINSMGNIGDNAMYMIAMFDINNIKKLLSKLQAGTITELEDGRLPEEY